MAASIRPSRLLSNLLPRWLVLLPRIAAMAARALWAYKLRSLFVILAVGLGIGSLTVIVAAVDGAQQRAVEITEMFGPDAAFVLGGDIFNRPVGQRTQTLSWADARAIRDSLPGVELVVPMRRISGRTVKYRAENTQVDSIIGSTANYATSWNWPLAEGRDISQQDVDTGARVALLGSTPNRELFGDTNAIGKTIFVDDFAFQIIGVLTERGLSGGGRDANDRIIAPLTTLTQRFNLDRQYFRALRIVFADAENMAANSERLRSYLRHLHNLQDGEPDDFSILTADEVLRFLSMLQGSLVAFLGVTAGVAILVGGFVLANLFYLSVSERAREIGLRMAMGARPSAIITQFLCEAVLLTSLGAIVGMGFGLALGQLLAGLDLLTLKLSWKIFFLSLAAATAIGLLFGIRPARAASQLNPIEALKG